MRRDTMYSMLLDETNITDPVQAFHAACIIGLNECFQLMFEWKAAETLTLSVVGRGRYL